MNAVHFSSAKSDWQTPEWILERVRQVAPIGLDPCTTDDNPTGAAIIHTEEDPSWDWEGWCPKDSLIYVNPPYGRQIAPWVERCSDAGRHRMVIALLPARTDTKWFPWDADQLCFLRGRLRFVGAKHPAPFPSVLACWAGSDVNHIDEFVDAFRDVGTTCQKNA